MRFTFLLFFIVACHGDDLPTPNLTSVQRDRQKDRPSPIAKWSEDSLPVQLKISEDFSSQEQAFIEEMANKWVDSVNHEFLFFENTLETTTNRNLDRLEDYYDNEIGIYKSYDWFTDIGSSVLALTRYLGVYETDPRSNSTVLMISHADIIFNYRDFGSIFTTDQQAALYDLPSIALHEMGHLLGLGHLQVVESIMYPQIDIAEVKRDLFSFDVSTITNRYDPQVQSLNASALVSGKDSRLGEEAVITIYLHANGTCEHFKNGNKIRSHFRKI